MASEDPRLWGQRPYPSPLETEAGDRSLGLEGEGRSWGGGRGAPWRPHEWEERVGPQSPPSMEGKGGSYGISDMGVRRRPWLPPREEEGGSWGATNRGPRETPRECSSLEQEGRRGSCEPPRKRVWSTPVGDWLRVPLSPPREDSWEPPQKRFQSPPMDERWMVPLSPPKGRGSTSPNSQRQPSSRSSQRDSPSNGGILWVSQGRRDGPTMNSRGRSQELPQPAWESCCDLETLLPTSRRRMEGRDLGRSKWLEDPGSSSSSSHHRSRRDPGWETSLGSPVDGSYSLKVGGSRESWSGRGFQSFKSQIDSREQDNRGLKGWQNEGWARDEGLLREDQGRSMGSPRESIPQKGQGVKESFTGNFMGPKGRYKGYGTQAATTGMFFPHLEVVNYWKRCHHIIRKKAQDKFSCPRPSIPDRSSKPPLVNPDLEQLMIKHGKPLFTSTRFSLQTHREVLTMVAPAMTLYEMAEAAIERKEGVDPLAVRQLARSLLSFAGSANRELTVLRSWQVLLAIDPRLTSMMPRKTGQNSSGLLFAKSNVNILKKAIRSLPKLTEEPPERNCGNCWEERKPMLIASPPESPPFQDGSASFPEMSSDQQVQLQDEASLELWHRRFGHADSAVILRLQNNNLVTGIKVDPGEADSTARCLTCLKVKDDEPSFSLNTVSRSALLMDLIHCELSGPINIPSLRHQRYVLIFVDDYSRYCITFLLKETSEMHRWFERYFAIVRRTHKMDPKVFQMNSVVNSISPKTLDLLKERGISHQKGVECISGQSRTAEREMKSLLEMTWCMLADANLPGPFWGYAILAATYLWNRLAVTHMKRTPFEAWSGKMPCVNHLRVFGSLICNRENPNDPTQHINIGYTFSLAKYTVMNLETGLVSLKDGLDFDERQGVEKRGNFLVTLERHACNIEPLTGTGGP